MIGAGIMEHITTAIRNDLKTQFAILTTGLQATNTRMHLLEQTMLRAQATPGSLLLPAMPSRMSMGTSADMH